MKLLDSMRGMYPILGLGSLGKFIGLNLREATKSVTSGEKRVDFLSFSRASTDAGSSQAGGDGFLPALPGHHSLARLLQRAILLGKCFGKKEVEVEYIYYSNNY